MKNTNKDNERVVDSLIEAAEQRMKDEGRGPTFLDRMTPQSGWKENKKLVREELLKFANEFEVPLAVLAQDSAMIVVMQNFADNRMARAEDGKFATKLFANRKEQRTENMHGGLNDIAQGSNSIQEDLKVKTREYRDNPDHQARVDFYNRLASNIKNDKDRHAMAEFLNGRNAQEVENMKGFLKNMIGKNAEKYMSDDHIKFKITSEEVFHKIPGSFFRNGTPENEMLRMSSMNPELLKATEAILFIGGASARSPKHIVAMVHKLQMDNAIKNGGSISDADLASGLKQFVNRMQATGMDPKAVVKFLNDPENHELISNAVRNPEVAKAVFDNLGVAKDIQEHKHGTESKDTAKARAAGNAHSLEAKQVVELFETAMKQTNPVAAAGQMHEKLIEKNRDLYNKTFVRKGKARRDLVYELAHNTEFTAEYTASATPVATPETTPAVTPPAAPETPGRTSEETPGLFNPLTDVAPLPPSLVQQDQYQSLPQRPPAAADVTKGNDHSSQYAPAPHRDSGMSAADEAALASPADASVGSDSGSPQTHAGPQTKAEADKKSHTQRLEESRKNAASHGQDGGSQGR